MTPFVVLVRTFLAQFFASESVSSDMRLRESMVFVLAFVLTPCVFLIVSIFPQYQLLTLPVSRRWLNLGSAIMFAEVRFRMAQDMLEWLSAVLVCYAMVAAGLVAVFVWDSLTFDRRDAMVLGPLPIPPRTLMLAKLAALALFLLGAAVGLNLLNAAVFALTMTVHIVEFPFNLVSILTVTTAAAAFVFALIVSIRSFIVLIGGARFASRLGSAMQFLFVAALISFLISVVAAPARPGLLHIPEFTLSPPVTWFVAAFEVIRRSPRGSWDEFVTFANYAFLAVPAALVFAIAGSIAAHHRQMQLALAAGGVSDFRRARVSRAIARVLLPRDGLAQAVSDFILTTIARNPAQRLPIAINAALGLGMVVLALSRARDDASATLMAMPLIAAFWLAIGMRASFFVPSQLPAAWAWFVNAPDRLASYRSATRASIVSLVAPGTVLLAAAVGGWRHAGVALAFVVAFAAFVALTVDFIPFTRPYRPGHARLRRRWPLYLAGAYGATYGLVAIEQAIGGDLAGSVLLIAGLLSLAAAFDVAGRLRSRAWRIVSPVDPGDADENATIVLGLDAAENRPMIRIRANGV
jgi:hypothetical protein